MGPPHFLVTICQSHTLRTCACMRVCVCLCPYWMTLAKHPCLSAPKKEGQNKQRLWVGHLAGCFTEQRDHLTVPRFSISSRDMGLVAHGADSGLGLQPLFPGYA